MSAQEMTIEAHGVRKIYGTGAVAFEALKGVDFYAYAGEFVMLNGPSGSGKTTLLSVLGCVLSTSAGTVRILDSLVSEKKESDLPRLRLAYIGFIFQGHNLIASLSALENVCVPLQMRGHSGSESQRLATELLVRVGLSDKLHRKPAELSGGQRQRISIARAVAGDPPIILADEPTASLDAETGLSCTQLLKDMARERGHTVVVVTHDNRIFHLADRVVNIEDGLIVKGHDRHSLRPQGVAP